MLTSNKTDEVIQEEMKSYTMVELVMVILVAGIVSGIFAIIINQAADTYSFITIRENVLSEAELALERIVREIRQIKSSAAASEVIYKADSSEFQFVDVNDTIIDFRQDGSLVFRSLLPDGSDGDILAEDITSLAFTYWGTNNNELTPVPLSAQAIQELRRVEISMNFQKQAQQVKIKTQAYPRNLEKMQ